MSRLNKNKIYLNEEWTSKKVEEEINAGIELLESIPNKIVSFFGSHKNPPDSDNYKHCKNTAKKLAERNYAVISGGGPGVMHAANSGAKEIGVPSIGMKASLIKGEVVDDNIFTHVINFDFLFIRRFMMSIKSEALIFYPGGYGTLNELFEYAVLMQINITDKVPIICVNRGYWKGLFDWLEQNIHSQDMLIQDSDMDLIKFVDDFDEIIELIES